MGGGQYFLANSFLSWLRCCRWGRSSTAPLRRLTRRQLIWGRIYKSKPVVLAFFLFKNLMGECVWHYKSEDRRHWQLGFISRIIFLNFAFASHRQIPSGTFFADIVIGTIMLPTNTRKTNCKHIGVYSEHRGRLLRYSRGRVPPCRHSFSCSKFVDC